MAYFANGTEGDRLEALCAKCIHGGFDERDDLKFCAAYALAINWNYEQCKDETKREALSVLMPDKNHRLCAMFVPVSGSKLSAKLFEIVSRGAYEKLQAKVRELEAAVNDKDGKP